MKTPIAPLLLSALCAASPAQTEPPEATLILLGPADVWLTLPPAQSSPEVAALRAEYLASLASLEASLPSPTVVASGTYAPPQGESVVGNEPVNFHEAAGVDAVLPSPQDLVRGPWHLNRFAHRLPAPLVASDLDLRGLPEAETRYTAGAAPITAGGERVGVLLSQSDPNLLAPVLDLPEELAVEPSLLAAQQASAEPLPAVVLSLAPSEVTGAITLQVPALAPDQAAVFRLGSLHPVPPTLLPEIVDLLAADASFLREPEPRMEVAHTISAAGLEEDVRPAIPYSGCGEIQRLASDFPGLPPMESARLYFYELTGGEQGTRVVFGLTVYPVGGLPTRLFVSVDPTTREPRLIWTPVRTAEGRITSLPDLIDRLVAEHGLLIPEAPPELRGLRREYEALRQALGFAELCRASLSELP